MNVRALVLGLCACSLGGHRPHYDYFVLASGPAPARPATAAQSAPTVGVSHVSIPAYLDREPIVTRSDDERISYSRSDHWAEPLDAAFTRVLEQDMAAALAPAGISVPPHTASPTYDIQVDVLRFERRGDARVELWARWTVRSESRLLHVDESRVQVATGGVDNAAATAALSRAISRLADDIASNVKRVSRSG